MKYSLLLLRLFGSSTLVSLVLNIRWFMVRIELLQVTIVFFPTKHGKVEANIKMKYEQPRTILQLCLKERGTRDI